MAFGGTQGKEFMKSFGWHKRIPHNQNNNEDGMKLEPQVIKRTGQDLRETLLRSANVETNEEASMKNIWRTKLKTENEEIF